MSFKPCTNSNSSNRYLNTYTYKKVYKSNNNKNVTNCIKMEYQSLCVSITCKKEIKDLTKFFARTHHFLKKKGGV